MAGLADRRRWTAWLALAAVVGAAGCGDDDGAIVTYDPNRSLAQIDAVLHPFETGGDLLLGLDLAVITLEYHGAATLADVVSLRADRHRRALGELRTTRSRRWRGARPGPADGTTLDRRPEALTLPPSLVGQTLVWDEIDGYRVSTRGGAPGDGVRFALYRMDDQTGYPASPRTEIGYLDVTDEDGASTEGVRVRAVRTSGPSRVMADYRVRLDGLGSYEEGEMELRADGELGESDPVSLDLEQRLWWSWSQDRDELDLDYRFGAGAETVELAGHAESRYEAPEWATFDFEVRLRGPGSDVEVAAGIREDGSLRGMIRTEGRDVVRLDGTEGAPRFEATGGARLDWRDEETLLALWIGIADLIWYTDWLLVPADLLIAAG